MGEWALAGGRAVDKGDTAFCFGEGSRGGGGGVKGTLPVPLLDEIALSRSCASTRVQSRRELSSRPPEKKERKIECGRECRLEN